MIDIEFVILIDLSCIRTSWFIAFGSILNEYAVEFIRYSYLHHHRHHHRRKKTEKVYESRNWNVKRWRKCMNSEIEMGKGGESVWV